MHYLLSVRHTMHCAQPEPLQMHGVCNRATPASRRLHTHTLSYVPRAHVCILISIPINIKNAAMIFSTNNLQFSEPSYHAPSWGGADESSHDGSRIHFHVNGHKGPKSYRFGYDTGKGYVLHRALVFYAPQNL